MFLAATMLYTMGRGSSTLAVGVVGLAVTRTLVPAAKSVCALAVHSARGAAYEFVMVLGHRLPVCLHRCKISVDDV